MIHPDIRVADIDPWEWARLGEAFLQACPPPARTIAAVLEKGRVLRMHDSKRGTLPPGRRAGGPKAFAARLLASTKADRVIVAERSALEEYQRAASSRDGREMAVLDWLAWRGKIFREKFASRIAILPEPPADTGPFSYGRVRAFAGQCPDGLLVSAVFDGERRLFSGIARVTDKRIVAFSTFSAIAADGTFPHPADFPAALKAASARMGPVRAAVRAPIAVFKGLAAGAHLKVLADALKKGEAWGQGAKSEGLAAVLGLYRFVGPGSPRGGFPVPV